jgi:hypothetical protein
MDDVTDGRLACPQCPSGQVLHWVCTSSGRDFWRCDARDSIWIERAEVGKGAATALADFLTAQGIQEAVLVRVADSAD